MRSLDWKNEWYSTVGNGGGEVRGEIRPTVWNSLEQTLGQKLSRFENVNEMNGL